MRSTFEKTKPRLTRSRAKNEILAFQRQTFSWVTLQQRIINQNVEPQIEELNFNQFDIRVQGKGGVMGLFGKKKVRFGQWGSMTVFQCPCDPKFGPNASYPQRDETVPEYPENELTKCWNCGAIFISYGEKHQGKIVGKGRTFEEERSQGIEMRLSLSE